MLIDIRNDDHLKERLVLPTAFRNQLSLNCTSIKLIDYNNRQYSVHVESAPSKQCVISLAQWGSFVNEVIVGDIRRLCFRLVGVNTFQVFSFDKDGFEYIPDDNGQLLMNRFLTEATEETFRQEFAPPTFLDLLNVKVTRKITYEGPPKLMLEKTVRIIGSKQHGKVNVIYKWVPECNEWKAYGFEGSKWTNLCILNNVEPGYTLMFSKSKDGLLTLDVFNFADVGLGLADDEVDDDLVELSKEEGYYLLEDPDCRDLIHECRVQQHKHKVNRPHFFCKLSYRALTHKHLTVEKFFVEEFGVNKYKTAVIHFGELQFCADMYIKEDKRVVGEQNHVVMVLDWRDFSEQTGIVEGECMRFQLNLNKSVVGETIDFDVC